MFAKVKKGLKQNQVFQVTHDDHIFKELSCKYKCLKNPKQGRQYIMQSHSFPAFLTDLGRPKQRWTVIRPSL